MSDSHSFYKKFLRALGRNLFFALRWTISRLPYPIFRFFTVFFVTLGRPLIARKKKLALENLHMAFGNEKSEAEINKIADQCFNNFATGMIELIYFIDRPKKNIEKVTIDGQEILDEALSHGHGAILLSAHFGNFILMYLRMALAGYKINCIMRRVRDIEFEEYISNFRNQNGLNTIYSLPHRQCVVNSLKRLKNNEVLFILLDQNYGDEGGVFVDFFGQQAATATGPVVFSNRSGAPILPIFIRSDGPDRYKIKIDQPVTLQSTQNEQDIVANVSKLTKIIEGYIRLYPHEWGGWMHRRWKSRPTVS